MLRHAIVIILGAMFSVAGMALMIEALPDLAHDWFAGTAIGFVASYASLSIASQVVDATVPEADHAWCTQAIILVVALPMLASLVIPTGRTDRVWPVIGVVLSCAVASIVTWRIEHARQRGARGA